MRTHIVKVERLPQVWVQHFFKILFTILEFAILRFSKMYHLFRKLSRDNFIAWPIMNFQATINNTVKNIKLLDDNIKLHPTLLKCCQFPIYRWQSEWYVYIIKKKNTLNVNFMQFFLAYTVVCGLLSFFIDKCWQMEWNL